MQKHGVILDMSYNKLAFWLGYCQHPGFLLLAVNTPIELHFSTSAHLSTSITMPLALHVENPITSAAASAEPQKSKKLKKLKKIEIPLAIPGIRLAYQGVSKFADSKREKYIIPAKRIFKPATTPKLAPPIDETKLLDLAFIGATLIQYLARQKDVEIFAVSM